MDDIHLLAECVVKVEPELFEECPWIKNELEIKEEDEEIVEEITEVENKMFLEEMGVLESEFPTHRAQGKADETSGIESKVSSIMRMHCDMDSVEKSDERELRHLQGASEMKRGHRCDCGKIFDFPSQLKKHKQLYKKNRPCSLCQSVCARDCALSGHRHTGGKPFSCDICSVLLTTKGRLTRHKQLHTRKLQRPLSCSICTVTFSCRSLLRRHECSHTGERPFVCDVCSKSYVTRGNLTRHMRQHKRDQQFYCDVCSNSYHRKDGLIEHMQVHTGERPYACSSCPMTFNHHLSLKYHEHKHTGERPFCCDICSKTFITKGHLIRHIQRHTGQKPFQCEICSKSFYRKDELTSHMRIHAGERPRTSRRCPKTSSNRSSLKIRKKMSKAVVL